jgi:hypothetical protein
MFDHYQHGIILEDISSETTENGRYYFTPNGKKYPSVTTVLSGLSKDKLVKWKERVGEEEAKKVSLQATNRGTEVHLIAEEYLNNIPTYKKGKMPVNLFTFNQIKPILDERINNIWFQEAPLYSDYIEVAGRVDLIAEFDGKLSIIDFKTSKRIKDKKEIKSYFMQESFYAVAFEERTKIPINQLVTIMTVDDSSPLVFIEKRNDHIHDFIKIRKSFKTA